LQSNILSGTEQPTTTDDQASPPLSELELLTGVPEIAAALDKDQHTTRALLEAGLLPGFFLGGRWYARRSTLAAYFGELEKQQLLRGAIARTRPASRWQTRGRTASAPDNGADHRDEPPKRPPPLRTRRPKPAAKTRGSGGDAMEP
jgi:hypothetical protein